MVDEKVGGVVESPKKRKTNRGENQWKRVALVRDELEKKAAKYPGLTFSFFSGRFNGQLETVWRTRKERPDKVADFIRACLAGDLDIPKVFTELQAEKLAELGLPVNPEFVRKRWRRKEREEYERLA